MYDAGTEFLDAPFQQKFAERLRRAALVVTLLVAAATPPAIAQWSTQSPLPTHLEVRGVAAPAPGRVFLATDDDSFDAGGALFESTDGGATWIQRDVPFDLSSGLCGIFFLDGQHGWVFGNANYRTTDGGTTWNELPFSRLDLLHGVLHRELRRRDRELRRVRQPRRRPLVGALAERHVRLRFADEQTGLGVAATGLYRTTDGGDTFALVRAGAADAVAFLSADGRGGHRRRHPRALDRRRRDLDGQQQRRGTQPAPRRLRRCRPGLGPKRRLSRLRRPHLPLRRRRRDLDRPRRSDRRGSVRRPLRVHRPGRRHRDRVRRRGQPLPLGRRRSDLDADVRDSRTDSRLPRQRGTGLRRRPDGLLRFRRRLRHQDDRRRRELVADLERHGHNSARHGPFRERRSDRRRRERPGSDQRRRRRALVDPRHLGRRQPRGGAGRRAAGSRGRRRRPASSTAAPTAARPGPRRSPLRPTSPPPTCTSHASSTAG